MEFAQAKDEENQVYAFDSVPIKKDAVINTTIKQMIEQKTYGVDTDGDGEIEKESIITVKPDVYVPVESIALSADTLELREADSSVLKVAATPSNVTPRIRKYYGCLQIRLLLWW